ncbi:hypothetical protein HELRODRAFT_173122 [Helobdella robusta]|uniref:Uncharacterized protein n=1 Tax=Helobdella robusta TaxID=6412 RepID=T1F6E4_HELRO|nr:hypothetical protein HELRODRAFT_173122 [Helobdella robusta]ESO04049.1 hypothetical protein HELRODRAFT_173122 [Helobdella robusta]
MYMTITYMEFILRQVFTDCNKSGYTCTVINRSGFIVLRINANHSLTACLVNQINQTNDNNMHINCEEPGLANTLIEKNILNAQFCVNYDDQNHNITKFWNVSMDRENRSFENFQIHQIPNMNIFVIVKNGSFSAEARCNCGEKNFGQINIKLTRGKILKFNVRAKNFQSFAGVAKTVLVTFFFTAQIFDRFSS